MAWVDVAKSYDSIDHEWLDEMMILRRFPTWLKNVTSKFSASWNAIIQFKTDKHQTSSDSEVDYPKVTPFFQELFTLCMNPVAWMLKATEGYKLSRLIGSKITDLLYVDNLKMFANQACNSDEVNTDSDERHGAEVESQKMLSTPRQERCTTTR